LAFIFGKQFELSQLKEINPLENHSRASVPILCIDDEGLEYEEIIRNHGFNIRVFKDIEDIKAVKEYPIVICDIQGVGKSFGSKYEGAHIIQEIKKHYPEKIVIAHTGQKHDARYNKFFEMSDFTLPKDIDSDEWIDNLDNTIKKVVDPIEQWKRMRDYLYKNDVTTKQVYLLEMEYIDSILSKDKSKFAKRKTTLGLSADVRGVLQGFVASLIFKLVIG
jgi:hypothetical protein